ncbi:MAG: hypothetical protein WBD34_12365 [Burkholderiaceae bacterium]
MDMLAHGLWGGALVSIAYRNRPIARLTLPITIGMAVWPDIAHAVPLVFWWILGDGTWSALVAYAFATPGQEPVLPANVALLSHHFHCLAHSVIVAGTVTLTLWLILRSIWTPLIGWGSHILIDIFTHSADYYAVPILYPLNEWGFDGIAWNTPWFIGLNYSVLGAIYLWILQQKRKAT